MLLRGVRWFFSVADSRLVAGRDSPAARPPFVSFAHRTRSRRMSPARLLIRASAMALMIGVATAALATTASYAAFPGTNGKIAFFRYPAIWTMDGDGTNQASLLSNGYLT